MLPSVVATTSIVPLVELWEAYVAECFTKGSTPEIPHFANWLLAHTPAQPVKPEFPPLNEETYERVRLPDKVAILIWRMARFMRVYFRLHFQDSALHSIDEFSMLAGINYLDHPTKTQLFQFEIMEATTGIQMLARLLRQNLIREMPDKADKRLKRVALTPKGEMLMAQAADQMDLISDELLNTLSGDELVQLEKTLLRLNTYHSERK